VTTNLTLIHKELAEKQPVNHKDLLDKVHKSLGDNFYKGFDLQLEHMVGSRL
jgi:hypothetical protein